MQVLLELPFFYEVTAESNWHRKGTCSDSSRLRQVTEKRCINYLPAYQNTVHEICGYHSASAQCIDPINKKPLRIVVDESISATTQ